jgi:hypothetical protein
MAVATNPKRASAILSKLPTGRRGYADEMPRPKKKSGFFRATLRWTWRLTYLTVLGGVGYVGYIVYIDRHPAPQKAPDPSKKTIVVLGKQMHSGPVSVFLSNLR